MTREIDALFNKTKGGLFFMKGSGFLGRLLSQVEFSWTTEFDTAAISTKQLFWNPDFFMSLSTSQRITVLAHELWHNGLLHSVRMGNRCPDIWNVAGDHVINLLLKQHDYDMSGFPYIMDTKYIGWATEEVYDDLINSGPCVPQSFLEGDVLPSSPEDVPDAVANAVAAYTAAKIQNGAGVLPGEVELVIDTFLNPKLPWEVLLYNFFTEITSQEYSYARPNRRYDDPLLPGSTGRNGLEHLVYYLDISGSITDDWILRFNSEVKFIKEEFQPERLTLITFDTRVRDVYEFERDDPFEKIVVIGRGGTSLVDVMADLKKRGPTAGIIFTDLEVNIPPNPGIPIIWVCINNASASVPYGKLIHLHE